MTKRTRYKPATAERYMEAAERELAAAYETQDTGSREGYDDDIKAALSLSLAVAQNKAQMAQVAATIRLAEAQESIVTVLNQIGELMTMHPVFSHVLASRSVVSEQNTEIDQLKTQVATLELAQQPHKKKEADGKPN